MLKQANEQVGRAFAQVARWLSQPGGRPRRRWRRLGSDAARLGARRLGAGWGGWAARCRPMPC